MTLNKADILGRDDLPTRVVPVPEWGGDVRLRTMTGAERDRFEESLQVGRGKKARVNLANVRARLLALCVVGEDGARLFDEGDVALLGRKSAKALDRLFDAAREMNGFSEEDVEELAGNS